ncbi:Hypothetical predicted protein [Paramuricea clavata]|uniref:Uncharacterized protein n=1 Tax=Paramuricea clavata TaxID=317549 RepID=A0A7D9DN18_PARCT|nr:Hypothetical predicted protein [Paramuricea clavata]
MENYDGDTCRVSCDRDYKLNGPSTVTCTRGTWTDPNTGLVATANCESVDALFKDDVLRLVDRERKRSHLELACFVRDYLKNKYPGNCWFVTIYDDIYSFENHCVGGYYFHKFRYAGVNFVVTRYPDYRARRPRVPLSTIIGSVSGSHAKEVYESIKEKFFHHGESYYMIHVVKRSARLRFAKNCYDENVFYKLFSKVALVVVAP